MGASSEPDPVLTNIATADDAITFAERMMQLLDEASFSTTYKHALLLALMDACLELADGTGLAPSVLTVTDLAERVIALYWPHVVSYPPTRSAEPLSQSGTGQAEIVTLVRRARADGHGTARTLAEARSATTWDRLIDDVAWKLAEMPLPRLQRVGTTEHRFLYDIASGDKVTRRAWRSGTIDTTVRLQPGVGDHLIRLAGLLRPLVQRRWVERVCRLNPQVTDSTGILESFLFGADRLGAVRLRVALLDLQDGRCFYTGARIAKVADAQVDHFLPWARHPSDAIENLVVASTAANAAKLAAPVHVARWRHRLEEQANLLAAVAATNRWPTQPAPTLGVARAVYLRLHNGVPLWVSGKTFQPANADLLRQALAA